MNLRLKGRGLLSPREVETLRYVADGLLNKQIALRMRLHEGTVKNYVSNLLSELGVDSRIQLALQVNNINHKDSKCIIMDLTCQVGNCRVCNFLSWRLYGK